MSCKNCKCSCENKKTSPGPKKTKKKKEPMELTLEVFNAFCATSVFVINGVTADHNDFGTKGDESPDTAEDYACGDMRFTRKEATKEVLKKYSITLAEYSEVCDALEEKLSFGSCGWCV